MKKILFLLVLFVWGSVTFAQEIPEFKFFKIYGDLNGESVLLKHRILLNSWVYQEL